MTQTKTEPSIEEVERLLRPSGAMLAAGSNLGRAIECFAVDRSQHSSAILDLLVRLRFAPQGGLRGIDLVRQLHMSPGYVSRLIDQAEAEGLISRETDPRDRRAQLIGLTPVGEGVFDEFVPAVLEVLNETIYAALSAEEVEEFVDLLERIAKRSQEFLDRQAPSA